MKPTNEITIDSRSSIRIFPMRRFARLKFIAIFVLSFAYTHVVNAQDLQWAKNILGNVHGTIMLVDSSGCTYIAGCFNGLTDLDPGPAYLPFTSNGGLDIFISKLDESGNLIWVKSMGGASNDEPYGICQDSLGNIYTTGHFEGLVDFDPGPGNSFLSGAGNEDVFIHKLDSSGNFQWARRVGGPGPDWGRTICIDSLNYIYVGGTAAPSADFDPGTGSLILPSAGGYDAFVLKLNDSGNLVWAKNFGGLGSEWVLSVKAGHSGFLYLTGFFGQTADFDPGSGSAPMSSNGGHDVFFLKLDTAGNFNWVKAFGGTGTDEGVAITLTDAGHVCLTGSYTGLSVDLDPGAGTQSFTAYDLTTDIFIQKFDTAGDLVWVRVFGGDHLDEPASIKHDSAGNIYTTGLFRNSVDFNPGTSAFILTTLFDECPGMFLQKLSPSGIFEWAISTDCSSVGMDVHVDNSGGIYVAGAFGGDVDFDPWDEVFELSGSGVLSNTFVMKLGPCISPDTPVISSSGTVVCAGDSAELFISSGNLNSAVEWQWFDNFCGGNLIGSGSSIMVSPLSTTTYYAWGSANCTGPGVCDVITINASAPFNISVLVEDEMTGMDGSISLTVSGATNPYVFQWTGPGGFSSSNEDVSGLSEGYYEVIISDANGCDTTLTFGILSYVNIENDESLFSVAPNPVTDFFQVINSGISGISSLKLLDLSGRILYEAELTSEEYFVDMSGFEDGTYILILSSGDHNTVLKIVKT